MFSKIDLVSIKAKLPRLKNNSRPAATQLAFRRHCGERVPLVKKTRKEVSGAVISGSVDAGTSRNGEQT
jgi:hypothetical protein